MIGDVIIISEFDYKRAKKIVKTLKHNVVLIGGTSGSHKSELAYALQHELWKKKKSSFVVSLDDYYHIMPSVRNYNRKKQGLDSVGLQEIDWNHLQRIYEDYEDEKEIHFKRLHRFFDAVEHNVVEPTFNYLIFEGLFVNYLKKFYTNNYSIYLEGSPEQTLEFRQRRKKENANDEFRSFVVKKEYNIVCQLKRYADIIIPFEE